MLNMMHFRTFKQQLQKQYQQELNNCEFLTYDMSSEQVSVQAVGYFFLPV